MVPSHDEGEVGPTEFVKLNNQFVVPIVQADRVAALVVLSLSLETQAGARERVFEREPKLRDMFLRVLFDHANMGGFDGSFTRPGKLDVLRQSLADVAQKELGDDVESVLITDIARQDN
ncbi:MAG: flagellar basal body-associated FliL family protein [Sedimentitalea sp.]|uniref:flagellar basal body-associated FliL family protein n=1 Tax=Sedimentitalea sp. TaxID=2048915 RepID=UPI00326652B0